MRGDEDTIHTEGKDIDHVHTLQKGQEHHSHRERRERDIYTEVEEIRTTFMQKERHKYTVDTEGERQGHHTHRRKIIKNTIHTEGKETRILHGRRETRTPFTLRKLTPPGEMRGKSGGTLCSFDDLMHDGNGDGCRKSEGSLNLIVSYPL